jgi:hypothetical protein
MVLRLRGVGGLVWVRGSLVFVRWSLGRWAGLEKDLRRWQTGGGRRMEAGGG